MQALMTVKPFGSTIRISITGDAEAVTIKQNRLINFGFVNPVEYPDSPNENCSNNESTSCYMECSRKAFMRGCHSLAVHLLLKESRQHRKVINGRRISLLPLMASIKAAHIAKAFGLKALRTLVTPTAE